jgi:hypothetical protein
MLGVSSFSVLLFLLHINCAQCIRSPNFGQCKWIALS